MSALSLSVSSPRSAKGRLLATALIPSTTRLCSRTASAAHSVQPLWISVKVRVWTEWSRQDFVFLKPAVAERSSCISNCLTTV